MKKINCIECNKYRKFKDLKISYIFDKTLALSIICSKCGNNKKNIEKIFKEESFEISKTVGLIRNIENY